MICQKRDAEKRGLMTLDAPAYNAATVVTITAFM